jgi:hypothetical protein
MQFIGRIILAVLLSSIVPTILFMVSSVIFDTGFLGWAVVFAPFVFLTAIVHSVLLGVPSFFILKKFNKLSMHYFLFIGFMAGAFASSILAVALGNNPAQEDPLNFAKIVFLLDMLGLTGAIAFWHVMHRK